MPDPSAAARRILTTHAGSLPRPATLKHLLNEGFRGRRVDAAALADAAEAAVGAVIDRQIAAGIDILGDGEQGRESFFTYVQHRMSGFSGTSARRPPADITHYPGYREKMVAKHYAETSVNLMTAPRATGEIRHLGDGQVHEECERFARALAARGREPADAFLTATSPGMVAAAMDNDHYPTMEAYVDALADALAHEYRAIADAGFTVQIDAPDLAMERHCCFAGRPLDDYLAFARHVVRAIDRALTGIARERVRLHVCWGNYEGPHDFDVGLAEIWETVLGANVGAVLLSMANPRHAHEFRLLGELPLPPELRLVIGVIDTTTNYVEHPEVVADRIERAAEALGDPARILAGTDCGFETSAGFQSVHEDIAWAKLGSLGAGARLATERLF